MRLIHKHMDGPLTKLVMGINRMHLARFVLSIHSSPTDRFHCEVIFRVDSYPDYARFCHLTGDTPMDTKEFFE